MWKRKLIYHEDRNLWVRRWDASLCETIVLVKYSDQQFARNSATNNLETAHIRTHAHGDV